MKTILYSLAIAAALASTGRAEDGDGLAVDFRNDIIPVFTKHGCNAGACHGAAIGRGGFKLSLYGGNPAADYDAIVRQVGGRRVNLSRPNASLIVLKPAGHVEHGGDTVFDFDSDSGRLLLNWIEQGAGNASNRQLKYVEITPQKHIAKSLGEPVPLRAIAHYSDGSQRDVTRWTIFSAEDSTAVEIEPNPPRFKTLRRGRHIVVARYLSEVVPIEMIVPLTDSKVDLAAERRRNFVDEEILDTLQTLGLKPSPTIGDAAFLRRISLDLTGRVPTVNQVNEFLSDKNHDKRRALIDKLLRSEEFNEYWTFQLAKLLRVRPQRDDKQGALVYHGWLAQQIRDGVSYKRLASRDRTKGS